MPIHARRWTLFLLVVVCASLFVVPEADASHFRGALLNATPSPTAGCANRVRFTGRYVERRTYYSGTAPDGYPAVGDILNDGDTLEFGDTTSVDFVLRVVAIDVANDSFTAVIEESGTSTPGEIYHCYAGTGTYTAFSESCCTLSSDPVNPDSSFRVETTFSVGTGNEPPVVSGPTDVYVSRGTTLNFVIAASDPDGDTLTYRLATAAESGMAATIPGLSVNASTGLVTWAIPAGAAVGPYNVQFMVTDAAHKTPYGLVINVLEAGANNAPTFTSAVCGTTVNATVGVPMTINLSATDVDSANTVTISHTGIPAGANFSATPANPGTATFTWTPTVAGSVPLTFQASDGTVNASCSVVVAVAAAPAVDVPPVPTASEWGLGILALGLALLAMKVLR